MVEYIPKYLGEVDGIGFCASTEYTMKGIVYSICVENDISNGWKELGFDEFVRSINLYYQQQERIKPKSYKGNVKSLIKDIG